MFFSGFLILPGTISFLFGTGSYPPCEKGLHLSTRQAAYALPFRAPCSVIASTAYAEQVGKYGHFVLFKGERYF